MLTICDTHVLLFWADRPDRLTLSAQESLTTARNSGRLACAAISLWEIAVLFRKNRLILPPQHTSVSYMEDIILSLGLHILPLTPAIAGLAESGVIVHGDPGDRLIAATAIAHQALLITADEKLHTVPGLRCVW
ncbi:MAG: twitching motility protein PilT [Proteobacteria bacterium SG_bin4]|nr:MAG: twitching motility protein PilT [Proteobacteria bacterium SG_bin4]